MKQPGPILAALLAGVALIWVVATTMPEDGPPPRAGTPEQRAAPGTNERAGAPPTPAASTSEADQAADTAAEERADELAAERRRTIPPPQRSPSGPLDARIAQFEQEPRDSKAPQFEKHIASFFDAQDVPPGLLDSVLCRETICRVRMRWTTERVQGMLAASMRMFMGDGGTWPSEYLNPDPLLDPEANANPDGVVMVDMYVRRKTAAEAEEARKNAAAAKADIERMNAEAAAAQQTE